MQQRVFSLIRSQYYNEICFDFNGMLKIFAIAAKNFPYIQIATGGGIFGHGRLPLEKAKELMAPGDRKVSVLALRD
ncbi:MAG: hypothetical protein JSU88_00160 [Nitrospinaceae bacterium]|nr:MAG: hypothetical protein JSU88_00160 [Nitrospinaceae bacterium]